ncbi:hypothetical protein COT78_03890 [Candidatus Berkelbacteria bacterium CG10_big_fil_rev_8_21_14_0_10_43_13]|uniref:Metal-dependent hydrolase n=1 Tax=Candidatus Berkelbacteria bacterium CG10_big_fil_rev_8_21_14_0_10_43_13 TaxID=1974514 RepID=A0A2H0W5K0_9BACT|nr:MAG: hypothetical protein COT78_03890 [Candidatus Berkelbacteria bacterium CG10_big_fil_rev_8_21_14_0_10_43_13]
MTYKTHLSMGILFSSIVFLNVDKLELSTSLAIILFFSTLLGASTPDLDTPAGGLWQKIPAGSILSRIVRPVFIGGHRHLSHSLIGMGIFIFLYSLLLKWLGLFFPLLPITSYYILLSFVLGYASHLFADSLTEDGVPLLFPLDYHFGIPPNPFQKVRIKTGQWFENLVVYPLVNLAILIIIYQYYIHIVKR